MLSIGRQTKPRYFVFCMCGDSDLCSLVVCCTDRSNDGLENIRRLIMKMGGGNMMSQGKKSRQKRRAKTRKGR